RSGRRRLRSRSRPAEEVVIRRRGRSRRGFARPAAESQRQPPSSAEVVRGRPRRPTPHPAPSGRLDLDAPTLHTLRFRNANAQHAVVELGVDAFGVEFAWKRDAELEPADPARASPGDAFALALLDLARNR